MTKKIFLISTLSLFLLACGSDVDVSKDSDKEAKVKSDQVDSVEQSKESLRPDFFIQDTLFVPKKFDGELSKTEIEIIQKLGLCTGGKAIDSVDVMNPPCDARLFRMYQLNKNVPKTELFVLEIGKGLFGNKANKIVVLAKIADEYITLSSMIGYLVEKRTNLSGYDDLLVLHYGSDKVLYEMRYSWLEEEKRYGPSELEKADFAEIPSRIQDSCLAATVTNLTENGFIIE
jgi:hypothetical protein